MPQSFLSSDRLLASRIEAADAENIMAMTEALMETQADAAVEPFAGGFAIFAGVGSPMTHAVGIGMQRAVPEAELERMERFFRDRNSPCLIDLCPLADASVLAFVQNRPYRIIEFNNVLVRRISPGDVIPNDPRIRPVEPQEFDRFARLILRGFMENMPVTEDMVRMMLGSLRASRSYVAGEQEPEAGAAMGIRNNVALFYGDATLAESRRKGWQSRLIQARLAEAKREGCDLAVTAVLPGSVSHRNYEHAGFELLFMRVNLMREF